QIVVCCLLLIDGLVSSDYNTNRRQLNCCPSGVTRGKNRVQDLLPSLLLLYRYIKKVRILDVRQFIIFFPPEKTLTAGVHIFCFSCLQDSMPLSTLVMGDPSNTAANSMAQRLAKKTKKQVFVSCSLPMTDSNLSLSVEQRIKKEVELHPEHF
uniref:Proteasome assembly chaperone 4 n=1 Tax=Gasterosteus aculeatus aculeatus TaxID=481459 RepID=A0AAQ4QJI5_GASAC